MTDNTYNGWTNHETWQAALWLNETDYLGFLAQTLASPDEITPENVEDDVWVMFFEEETVMGSLIADVVSAWLRQVDFYKLAENYKELLEEEYKK